MRSNSRVWMLLSPILGLSAIAAMAMPACSSDDDLVAIAKLGGGCSLSSDCTSPLVCAFQSCHQQCASTRDCPAGDTCVSAAKPYDVCQAALTCTLNSDCPGTQVCGIDHICRDGCTTDRDCVSGEQCVDLTCANTTDIADGGLINAEAGVSLGAACTYSSQCPGDLVCLGAGVCGVECVTDKDCLVGYTCANSRCISPVSPVDASMDDATVPTDAGHDAAISDAAMDAADAADSADSYVPPQPPGVLTTYPLVSPAESSSAGLFVNGLFYVLGDDGFQSSTVEPLYYYDPSGGVWTEPTTNLDSQSNENSRLATDGAKIYTLFGAYSPSGSSYSTKIRAFTIATSTWADVADCSTATIACVGRTQGVATYYAGSLYYYAGLTSSDPSPEANYGPNYYSTGAILIYNLGTSTWSRINAPTNGPTTYFQKGAGVVVGSKWYIIGGSQYQTGDLVPNLYSFDFTTQTFALLASNVFTNYTGNGTQAAIAANGNQLHIINDGKYVVYDIGTGMVTNKPDLPANATFTISIMDIHDGSLYIQSGGTSTTSSNAGLVRVTLE